MWVRVVAASCDVCNRQKSGWLWRALSSESCTQLWLQSSLQQSRRTRLPEREQHTHRQNELVWRPFPFACLQRVAQYIMQFFQNHAVLTRPALCSHYADRLVRVWCVWWLEPRSRCIISEACYLLRLHLAWDPLSGTAPAALP